MTSLPEGVMKDDTEYNNEVYYTSTQMRDFAEQSVDEFRQRIAKQIEAMPFGDTAASFAVWIREQK